LALADEPRADHLLIPRRRFRVPGRAFLGDHASGLGSNVEFASHDSIEVKVATLDGLVERLGLSRLDFVKADIEGAEAQLIAGASETLRRFHPTLLLELEDRHLVRFDTSVDAVAQILAGYGYAPSHWANGYWADGIGGRNVLFRTSRV
jgi:hypothetical protein